MDVLSMLLLSITISLLLFGGQGRHVSGESSTCTELEFPHNLNKRWLLAENAMNGLCNQLIGVYSYIPISLLWNSSLVIGDMYSRGSFDIAMPKYSGWNKVPFPQFFDFDHFSTTWRAKGVDMILLSKFQDSCAEKAFTQRIITRNPPFWPNKDAVMNAMVKSSGIPLPFPDNSVVKFDDVHPKFTAMYNFWKGGLKNKMLLLNVHRSLRPAAHIQQIIDAILQQLPKTFLVAHIRLEGDYLLHEEVDFTEQFELAMKAIASHNCLSHLPRTTTGALKNPPELYVASGIFNSSSAGIVGNTETSGQNVLKRLREMGFKVIYSREALLNAVIAAGPSTISSSSSSSRTDTGNATTVESHRALVKQIKALLPEQGALVDLAISRASSCFIPAHYASSFSYMAQRMRYLDRGQVLRYPEISDANFGICSVFKQWGV